MKKKSGTNLRPGSYYRILELDPHDPHPSLNVGAIVLCAAECKGCIDPENHLDDGMGTEWFADYSKRSGAYRTLVNAVEFIGLTHPNDRRPTPIRRGETDTAATGSKP